MERIGVRELRQHASRYLSRVKAGESVEVTERGQLVALLVPPGPGADARERLVAAGRIHAWVSSLSNSATRSGTPGGREQRCGT